MKINTKELQNALKIVKPGLAQRPLFEQATSFAFVAGHVVTYNDEVSISHPVENLTLEGAVDAQGLYNLLDKINKDTIELELKKQEIRLTAARSQAGLHLETQVKLPLSSIGQRGEWQPLPKDFIRLAKFAVHACSSDNTRPVLTSVHLNGKHIEGSDNYRIARCVLSKKLPIEENLVPARSMQKALQINPTAIAVSEGWVHFTNNQNTIINCRTVQDEYPNVEPWLQTEGPMITLPSTTTQALQRAHTLVRQEDPLDELITVHIADRRLTIKSTSKVGWFTERINIRYNDDPIKFMINPYLLQSILNETLTFIYSENRLRWDGDGWVYVTALYQEN